LGVGDGLQNAVGVLVGNLSGAAGLLGLLGDVAVPAAEDGGGIADPGEGRLGVQGSGSRVRVCLATEIILHRFFRPGP
jgi:hypothetical protein